MRITGKRSYAAAAVAAAVTCLLGFALAGHLKPRRTSLAPVADSPQDLRLRLEGIETPVVPIKMAAGTPTVVEIPADDFFYVVHPGDHDLVTLDENSIRRDEHFFVLRTGSDFPHDVDPTAGLPPPESAKTEEERAKLSQEQTNSVTREWTKWQEAAARLKAPNHRPTPVTQLTVQTTSGATFTISVSPADSPAEATRRVVVTYDRQQITEARKAAGLPVNLDERRPRPQDEQ